VFVLQTIIHLKVQKCVKVKEGSLGNTIFMDEVYFVWTTLAYLHILFFSEKV